MGHKLSNAEPIRQKPEEEKIKQKQNKSKRIITSPMILSQLLLIAPL